MTREKAIEQLENLKYHCEDLLKSSKSEVWENDVEALEMAIKALGQKKTGHWIRFKNNEDSYYHIKCSECGQYWSVDGHAKIFKHCFNCGAKMEVEA